jgi:hypothetical protein
MTTNTQLELGLKAKNVHPAQHRQVTRVARAKWWFNQMRETVEKAIDWQTEPAPRAEQIWMTGTHRSPQA